MPLERISLEAPESLRQIISLQTDRLNGEERRALEMPSVGGFSFTTNVNALGATVDQEKFESICEEPSRQ